jgi:hypothetical protein
MSRTPKSMVPDEVRRQCRRIYKKLISDEEKIREVTQLIDREEWEFGSVRLLKNGKVELFPARDTDFSYELYSISEYIRRQAGRSWEVFYYARNLEEAVGAGRVLCTSDGKDLQNEECLDEALQAAWDNREFFLRKYSR